MPKAVFAAAAFVLAASFAAQPSAHAEDEYRIPYDRIRAAAQKYLDTCVTPKDVAKMEKKLKDRVDDRVHDQGVDRERAAREIMLDWAADNRSKLEKKDPKAVAQACFYFVIFIDRRYLMPGALRAELDEETCNKIIDHLEKEAAKAGGSGEKAEKSEKKDEKKKDHK